MSPDLLVIVAALLACGVWLAALTLTLDRMVGLTPGAFLVESREAVHQSKASLTRARLWQRLLLAPAVFVVPTAALLGALSVARVLPIDHPITRFLQVETAFAVIANLGVSAAILWDRQRQRDPAETTASHDLPE